MRNDIRHVAALLAMAFASGVTAEEIACLEIGTRADVRQLAYSPDGSMLVSVSGSDLSVWDVKKKGRLWNGGFAARVLEMPTFVPNRQRL